MGVKAWLDENYAKLDAYADRAIAIADAKLFMSCIRLDRSEAILAERLKAGGHGKMEDKT